MLPKIYILHALSDIKHEQDLSKHLFLYEKIKPVIEVRRDADLVGKVDLDDARKAAAQDARKAEVAAADIVVLLLSPDLLQECYTLAQQALRARKRVVPVMVRPTEWKETDFGGLRPLPPDERPVALWKDVDSAWVAVVKGLRGVWERVAAEKAQQAAAAKSAQATPPYQPVEPPLPPPRPPGRGDRVKVLFLSANPAATGRLSITEEYRRVKDRVIAAEHRDRFEFFFEPEVRINQVATVLMRHRPHIVHFSGHGTETGGIVMVDPNQPGGARAIEPALLRQLFNLLSRNLLCVVLNSCWSARDQNQALALADVAGCVVGVDAIIKDRSAVEFAGSFYEALGFGESVQTAFDLARLNVQAVGQPDADVLKLYCRKNVDPTQLRAVE